MYDRIFFTNVLRLLKERGITKAELHSMSGVSASIISDITRGQGNPTLDTMTAIANALETPLPEMLMHVENDVLQQISEDEKSPLNADLPKGFQRVSVVLPDHKAFIVNKWSVDIQSHLRKNKPSK